MSLLIFVCLLYGKQRNVLQIIFLPVVGYGSADSLYRMVFVAKQFKTVCFQVLAGFYFYRDNLIVFILYQKVYFILAVAERKIVDDHALLLHQLLKHILFC